MTERPWVIVYVKSGQVTRAAVNARQQGYEWYVPRGLFRSPRTHKLREEPLFPGYAFARHPEGRWTSLQGTFGVAGVMLVAEEKPALLPNEEINKLRAREGTNGLVRLEAREFTAGELVHVDHGVVTLDAIVDGMAGRDRIYVLMSAMGRQVRTEVDVKDVTRG